MKATQPFAVRYDADWRVVVYLAASMLLVSAYLPRLVLADEQPKKRPSKAATLAEVDKALRQAERLLDTQMPAQAVLALSEALEKMEAAFGADDSRTTIVRFKLAQACDSAGDKTRAIELTKQVIAWLEQDGQNREKLPELYGYLGSIYYSIDATIDAANSFEAALASQDRQLPRNDSLTSYLLLRAADCQRQLGKLSDAKGRLERAWKLYESSGENKFAAENALLLGLVDACGRYGDQSAAISYAREHVRVCEAAFGRESEETALAMCRLARAHTDAGEHHQAGLVADNSRAILERLFGEGAKQVVPSLAVQVSLMAELDDLDSALELNERLLGILERAHPAPSSDKVAVRTRLGIVHFRLGAYAAAREQLNRAQALVPPGIEEHVDVLCNTESLLGSLDFVAGDHESARKHFEASIELAAKVPDDPQLMIDCLRRLAELDVADARYSDATKALDEAGAIAETLCRDDNASSIAVERVRGTLYTNTGQFDRAKAPLNQALAFHRKTYPQPHSTTARTLLCLGDLHLATGDFDAAEAACLEASDMWRTRLGEKHPDTLQATIKLGRVYHAKQQTDKAHQLLSAGLKQCEEVLGKDHPVTADAQYRLAVLLCDQNQLAEALPLLTESLATHVERLGSDHPSTVEVQARLDRSRAAAKP